MKKGAVLPLHKHPQHETYLIVQGSMRNCRVLMILFFYKVPDTHRMPLPFKYIENLLSIWSFNTKFASISPTEKRKKFYGTNRDLYERMHQ